MDNERLVIEPPCLEVALTLALGLTVLSPYYCNFVNSLHLSGAERVLDFGSGSGVCSRHIARAIRQQGSLICVDISARWQKVIGRLLRNQEQVEFRLGRIDHIDLENKAFDLILVHYVWHEIPVQDWQQIAATLSDKLTPAGRFILREPLHHGLDWDQLESTFAQAGLKLVHKQTKKWLWQTAMDYEFQKG